jgi:hypothetical protein
MEGGRVWVRFFLHVAGRVLGISRRLDQLQHTTNQLRGDILSAKTELKAAIAEIVTLVDEVKADVADLLNRIPAEGGMSAAEVAEVKADLQALFVKAQDVADDHTPTA